MPRIKTRKAARRSKPGTIIVFFGAHMIICERSPEKMVKMTNYGRFGRIKANEVTKSAKKRKKV